MKLLGHSSHRERRAADPYRALFDTIMVTRSELEQVADVETDLRNAPPVVGSESKPGSEHALPTSGHPENIGEVA